MRNLMRRTAVLAGAAVVLLGAGMEVAAAQPLPSLTITPTAHPYGNVPVGETVSQTFTLANSGESSTSALTVTVTTPSEFTITDGTCRGALPPGQSCMVTVQFAPTEPGPAAAELTAVGARPGSRVAAELFGAGMGWPQPARLLTAATITLACRPP